MFERKRSTQYKTVRKNRPMENIMYLTKMTNDGLTKRLYNRWVIENKIKKCR